MPYNHEHDLASVCEVENPMYTIGITLYWCISIGGCGQKGVIDII